jgi:hypothetical protein
MVLLIVGVNFLIKKYCTSIDCYLTTVAAVKNTNHTVNDASQPLNSPIVILHPTTQTGYAIRK